jgi:hypothetical protein
MEVWIRYSVVGCIGSPEYNDEVEFRHRVLGPNHWSSMSFAGDERSIALCIEEDLAMLFILKYANCHLT